MSEVASSIGLDLLDVAGVELELLVDFEDVGGIIADMTGAGLFGDAILDRDIGGLVVEVAAAYAALWRACRP